MTVNGCIQRKKKKEREREDPGEVMMSNSEMIRCIVGLYTNAHAFQYWHENVRDFRMYARM